MSSDRTTLGIFVLDIILLHHIQTLVGNNIRSKKSESRFFLTKLIPSLPKSFELFDQTIQKQVTTDDPLKVYINALNSKNKNLNSESLGDYSYKNLICKRIKKKFRRCKETFQASTNLKSVLFHDQKLHLNYGSDVWKKIITYYGQSKDKKFKTKKTSKQPVKTTHIKKNIKKPSSSLSEVFDIKKYLEGGFKIIESSAENIITSLCVCTKHLLQIWMTSKEKQIIKLRSIEHINRLWLLTEDEWLQSYQGLKNINNHTTDVRPNNYHKNYALLAESFQIIFDDKIKKLVFKLEISVKECA